MAMQNQQAALHSGSWIAFTYASFFGAAAMVGAGVVFAPVDIWIKAYLAMGTTLLVQSCITLSKTLRDAHESTRFVNRIEDAKTERLLMEIERGKD
jgi:hypothetical protein